ncbi:AmmeMemoRadiSam system radical SAM enzyme [Stieleria sp. TO1_6]|uniref:AmmeMemoRadiSam system radical SAM enzyme n=1 Tax=Stieleria tagensis TaxID=2956795 RepID=UPI00209A9DDC|nr:AmmeMemoRadiSam system radical SAM enzyme [Stieleria tagensis]MCO8124941.1 AmmeMemoRadiSam system radical SAM enzyme [Stieleria tagensis]
MQTQWYQPTDQGRILCQLCPRACHLNDGDRGFCFVRQNIGGQMVLDTYGKSTGFCIDPIEKKPLNHFLPGTPVLSFGTAGCNLGCKFCQNWDISKSREVARLSDRASPEQIANAAQQSGCRSVAFTYNDPVIWAEYALDTAAACRQLGIRSVAVTAGYITPQARGDFFAGMDAANIDLKAFTEDFYFKLTSSHLQPVLDTIEYVCNQTDCWVELTNLMIPDANDSAAEITQMCEWILTHVGPNVPLHFTAFHPDFRMTDRNRTDPGSLQMAYNIARQCGLNYVYLGNVHDVARQSTYCHHCGELLIQRDWHQLGVYAMSGNQCASCHETIPGVFESSPGNWGARRQPVQIVTLT